MKFKEKSEAPAQPQPTRRTQGMGYTGRTSYPVESDNAAPVQMLSDSVLETYIWWAQRYVNEEVVNEQQRGELMIRAREIGGEAKTAEEAQKVFKREVGAGVSLSIAEWLTAKRMSRGMFYQEFIGPFALHNGQFPGTMGIDVSEIIQDLYAYELAGLISQAHAQRLSTEPEGDHADIRDALVKAMNRWVSKQINWSRYFPGPSPFPKEIHFIWSGRQISDTAMENVLRWAKQVGKDWRITMWSDLKISKWSESRGLLKSTNAKRLAGAGISLREANEILDPRFMQMYPVISKYNLAAASDLIRLSVLNQIGGVYADVDIGPGTEDFDALELGTDPTAMPMFAPALRDEDAVRRLVGKGDKEKVTLEDVEAAVREQQAAGAINNNFIVAHPRSLFLEPIINHVAGRIKTIPEEVWRSADGFVAGISGPIAILGMLDKMLKIRDGLTDQEADAFLKEHAVCRWLVQWLTADSSDQDWTLGGGKKKK